MPVVATVKLDECNEAECPECGGQLRGNIVFEGTTAVLEWDDGSWYYDADPGGSSYIESVYCTKCGWEADEIEPEETQDVPCPLCSMPVPMPKDWDGRRPEEALCNTCHEQVEEEGV